MAFHYWKNRGRPGKTRFVSLAGGYHGETLGALAVTDVPIFRDTYAPLLNAQHDRCRRPMRATRAPANRRATSPCAPPRALEAHLAAPSRDDRRVHRRAAGAGRVGHGDARSALPRAGARALHALRRAPDRRRDHDGLRPHRNDVRLRAGGHRAGLDLPVEGHHRRLPAAFVRAVDRRDLTPRSTPTTRARGFLHSHSYTGNALACRAALAVLDIFRADDVIAANRAKARALDSARGAARRASEGPRFPPSRHDLGVRRRHGSRRLRALVLRRRPRARAAAAADRPHRLLHAALHPDRRRVRAARRAHTRDPRCAHDGDAARVAARLSPHSSPRGTPRAALPREIARVSSTRACRSTPSASSSRT